MKEVMEMAMQELAQIAAAEEQARAICEQARAEAAELAVQAEKDGTARLNAVISGAQERMREAKQQAGQIVQDAQAQADRILAEAGAQVDARWAEFQKNADALIHAHDELRMLIQPRQENV